MQRFSGTKLPTTLFPMTLITERCEERGDPAAHVSRPCTKIHPSISDRETELLFALIVSLMLRLTPVWQGNSNSSVSMAAIRRDGMDLLSRENDEDDTA